MLQALRSGDVEQALDLLEDLSDSPRTMLHTAVGVLAKGQAGGGAEAKLLVGEILGRRADPNGRAPPLDETPLHVAVRAGLAGASLEVVRLLLEARADPALVDGAGEGPLSEATRCSHWAACELLLAHGAPPLGGAPLGASAAASASSAAPAAVAQDGRPAAAPTRPAPAAAAASQAAALEAAAAPEARAPPSGALDFPAPPPEGARRLPQPGHAAAAAGAVSGRTRSVSCYLVADESKVVNVYLKLEDLYEGASRDFVRESDFLVWIAPTCLEIRMRGPSPDGDGAVACWLLTAELPATVEPDLTIMRLRRGRLHIKLPKALQREWIPASSPVSEARSEARGRPGEEGHVDYAAVDIAASPEVPAYYAMLGVGFDVADDELKRAYRAAVLRWHPDKNPENAEMAHEKFKEVQEAYWVLSDPGRRRWYDEGGAPEDYEEACDGDAAGGAQESPSTGLPGDTRFASYERKQWRRCDNCPYAVTIDGLRHCCRSCEDEPGTHGPLCEQRRCWLIGSRE